MRVPVKTSENISKLIEAGEYGAIALPGNNMGLTEAQVFVEILQNQICLCKWPEM